MSRQAWSWLSSTALALTLALAGCGGGDTDAAADDAIDGPPSYSQDLSWPPELPNGWVLGVVTSVDADSRDHVWVLHRPRSAAEDQLGNAAPPVVEFDADGTFIQAWGGPASGYDWPDTEHGIFVDDEYNVWITGINPRAGNNVSDRSDDMLLKFTEDGTLLFQLGGYDVAGGNADTANPKQAADVAVYLETREAFVADGYGNTRVWVVDADTGEYRRMWGAFGNEPVDDPDLPEPAASGPGPDQFGSPVHGIAISNDGLVYVTDRTYRRIQVFSVAGEYLKQGFVARDEPPRAVVSRVALSADPDQRHLFASDFGGGIVWILNRETLETVGRFGERGTEPGQFGNLHHLAADSRNNVYTAEVGKVGGLQKWRPTGG